MGGIFISYRRDDAAGEAGRLHDRLEERFGADRVFRDVDALEPGQRFADEIETRLGGCDVLIALIGKRWRGESGADGAARLDDPDDFVRREIAAALRRGIPVVPALLHNTPMPRAEELPADLRPLAGHHAIELDTADFHDDVTRLIGALEKHVSPAARKPGPAGRRPGVLLAAAAAVAALLAALPLVFGQADVRLRSEPAVLSADEVRAMILERGFYSARTNPGAAPDHAWEVRVEGGVPVVLDEAAGLMWEGGGSGRPVAGGRDGALAHVQGLNAEAHAGFSDWRLPTLEEALSLVTPETTEGFHLAAAFDATAAPFVWTADDLEGEGGRAGEGGWLVYYLEGYAVAEPPELQAYVRAVRTR